VLSAHRQPRLRTADNGIFFFVPFLLFLSLVSSFAARFVFTFFSFAAKPAGTIPQIVGAVKEVAPRTDSGFASVSQFFFMVQEVEILVDHFLSLAR
jgi:hypothetical protein